MISVHTLIPDKHLYFSGTALYSLLCLSLIMNFLKYAYTLVYRVRNWLFWQAKNIYYHSQLGMDRSHNLWDLSKDDREHVKNMKNGWTIKISLPAESELTVG